MEEDAVRGLLEKDAIEGMATMGNGEALESVDAFGNLALSERRKERRRREETDLEHAVNVLGLPDLLVDAFARLVHLGNGILQAAVVNVAEPGRFEQVLERE